MGSCPPGKVKLREGSLAALVTSVGCHQSQHMSSPPVWRLVTAGARHCVPLALSIPAAAGLKISTTLSRASRGNEGGGRKRARGAVSPPATSLVSDLHLRFKQTRPLAK